MSLYPTTVTICWHWTCHPPLWDNLVWHNSGRNINPSPYPTMVTTCWHWPHHSPPWGCTVCRWWWCSVGSDPPAPPSGHWSGESVTTQSSWSVCHLLTFTQSYKLCRHPPPPPTKTHTNNKNKPADSVSLTHTPCHTDPKYLPCHLGFHLTSLATCTHTTPLATHTHTYYPSCDTDPH